MKVTVRFCIELLAYVIAYVVICFSLHMIEEMELNKWIVCMFTVTIVAVLVEIIYYMFVFRERNLLVLVFMVLTILFHFSHLLLLVIGYSFGSTVTNLPMVRFGEHAARMAFQISLRFQFANFLGFFLADFMNRHKNNKGYVGIRTGDIPAFTLMVFVIGIIAWSWRTLKTLFLTSTYGYATVKAGNMDIYLVLFGRLLMVAFILMIMRTRNSFKRIMILGFGILLYTLAMISGERAYNLISIGVLLYVYFISSNKTMIRIRYFAMISILGIALIIFLNTIRLTRENGMNLDLLLGSLREASSSPILSLINEFGISENVMAKICAEMQSINHGLQLLTAFIIVIPGISYIFPIDYTGLTLAGKFDAHYLGGSFIADFYFDFGELGILFSILYGILMAKFFYYYTDAIKRHKYFMVAYLSPILIELIFTIRSTTYKIPRLIVFYSIIFFTTCILTYIPGLNWTRKKEKDVFYAGTVEEE